MNYSSYLRGTAAAAVMPFFSFNQSVFYFMEHCSRVHCVAHMAPKHFTKSSVITLVGSITSLVMASSVCSPDTVIFAVLESTLCETTQTSNNNPE